MNMERSSSLGTKALKPPHLPSQNQVSPNLDLGGYQAQGQISLPMKAGHPLPQGLVDLSKI